MRRTLKSNLAALFLLAAAFATAPRAQQMTASQIAVHSQAVVRFDFERSGLQVFKYGFIVNEDGSGSYKGEETSAKAAPIQREFILSAATTKQIFTFARAAHFSPDVCLSKAKNMADTGKKTLTYVASGTQNSCSYDYSENKEVKGLTQIFQGIALTMDFGRQIDFLHRFDRLGLNDAMGAFNQAVSAGQAREVGTIATSLRSIASDAEVMQRVRAQANALLASIPADLQQPAP